MTRMIPELSPEYDKNRIIERPDGCYWVHQDSGAEYGPFASVMEAVADMQFGASGDATDDVAEALHEAEDEIGINDWIDPDTGEPAEETYTHIEDH